MQESSFASLGLSADLVRALQRTGDRVPFQIQTRAVPAALGGQDVLAKAPTGSGKTLAFAIPIVERIQPGDGRPAALVLVPTRELAVQVTEASRPRPGARAPVASVYGGVPIPRSGGEGKKAHVLVATPGRLQDLMDRRLVNLDAVSILVLDEADRMLDMGFKPQVDRILRKCSARPPDDVLLGHARRRRRRARTGVHEPAGPHRGGAAGENGPAARSTTSSSR